MILTPVLVLVGLHKLTYRCNTFLADLIVSRDNKMFELRLACRKVARQADSDLLALTTGIRGTTDGIAAHALLLATLLDAIEEALYLLMEPVLGDRLPILVEDDVLHEGVAQL